MNEILTIEQLSEYINIPKSCLYQKVMRRDIPFYRIGRLLRFKKSEIDEWLNDHRVERLDAKGEARKMLDAARKSALFFCKRESQPVRPLEGKGDDEKV